MLLFGSECSVAQETGPCKLVQVEFMNFKRMLPRNDYHLVQIQIIAIWTFLNNRTLPHNNLFHRLTVSPSNQNIPHHSTSTIILCPASNTTRQEVSGSIKCSDLDNVKLYCLPEACKLVLGQRLTSFTQPLQPFVSYLFLRRLLHRVNAN